MKRREIDRQSLTPHDLIEIHLPYALFLMSLLSNHQLPKKGKQGEA